MKIYKTSEILPEKCIETGEQEVWWWDSLELVWAIGVMYSEVDTDRYTHWTEESNIPFPEDN